MTRKILSLGCAFLALLTVSLSLGICSEPPKPALQILAQSGASSPVFAPAFLSPAQASFQPAASNPQNASILSPIPPPSPTSPTTFKPGVAISITGTAAGTGFQSFVIEWAPGLDASSGWLTSGITLAGAGLSPVTSGPLGSWDTSSVTAAGYYTIRLTVSISSTSYQALTMVYLEPDLLSSNWPQYLNLGPAFGAGVVPAANADGTFRLVMEAPAGPGTGTGEFWTLPLETPAQSTVQNYHGSFIHPAVANFSGAPGQEAMVLDFNPSAVTTELELFHEDGTFTTLSSNSNLAYFGSQLVVADLAGDSHLETLGYGIDYTNSLAYVSAWQTDGTQLNSKFPLQLTFQNANDGRLNRNPVLVGDINGDGKNEIVAMEDLSATTFALALFANDGTPLSWQVPALPGVPVVVAAADLDNNGKLETIVAANSDTQTFLHVFQPDGSERPGWPLTLYNSNVSSQSYLAVADLNLDGHKEIVYSHESFLYVFNQDASNFSSAWPLQAIPANEGFGYNAVAIGDVDGDGFPEIVTVLDTLSSSTDPYFAPGSYTHQQLLAIRRDGTVSKSWELTAGNGCWLQFYPTPAIGDFNQDGITDIAVTLVVFAGACPLPSGVVTLLSTGAKFNPGLNDWPLARHDPRATSVLQCSDFCLSASSAPPVSAGSPATYTLTATPNDFPYTTAVSSFTCSGLPLGASCNFSPSSVTPGLAPASATLTINTTSRTAATTLPSLTSLHFLFASPLRMALFGLFAVALMLVTRHRSRPKTAFLFLFLLFASALVVGCGSNSATAPPPNGTPAGTYTITVSATGASQVPKTANLSLTVN